MSRLSTAAVVAAVAVLGAVALADAVRGWREAEPPAPAPTTAPEPRREPAPDAEAVSVLRSAGVEGVLTYSDDDCRLAAVALPDLEPAPAPRIESCEPHVPTGGIGVSEGAVVWAGLGLGVVQVVLDSRDLERALRGRFGDRPYRALQATRLAGDRLVVLVEAGGPIRERLLAAFDRGRRLAWALPRWEVGEPDRLRASPRGGYVALLERERPTVRLFTREGEALVLPALTAPHAVAWSPDERWTAVATSASVWIFASEQPLGTALRVPVQARDLDWGT